MISAYSVQVSVSRASLDNNNVHQHPSATAIVSHSTEGYLPPFPHTAGRFDGTDPPLVPTRSSSGSQSPGRVRHTPLPPARAQLPTKPHLLYF